ncbi:MAG: sodium:solute symporter family transporter, partial [Glutamicibacter ardleyensis]
LLPVAVGGLVMAAAVAAMMSTASGALIAAATVARTDVTPFVASWFGKSISVNSDENPEHDVRANRIWVLVLGIVTVSLAILVDDVVAALTIAYDILVGGLLVAIIGGLLWKRGNGIGAAASMAAGTLVTLGTMIILEIQAEQKFDGVYANEPIYFGLIASAVTFIVISSLTRPTPTQVIEHWNQRVAGTAAVEGVEAGVK